MLIENMFYFYERKLIIQQINKKKKKIMHFVEKDFKMYINLQSHYYLLF